jgi:pyruvate formate lyase activating enzyme
MSTEATHIKATQHWHRTPDGRVECDVCPRHCRIKEGQQGMCFVRGNQNGALVLTTYNRASGFCIDPIEKKPLNHFLPGTPVLSFGTAGCNLACKFCQNWGMSKAREMDKLALHATPEMIAQAALQTGCRSVAYTYNDPVIFYEYAIDVAQACQAHGIQSVAVTAAYIEPQPAVAFFAHMDAANVDLKAFSERFYHKLTGGHLQPVLDTLIYLKKHTSLWFEITTLLIPGENDTEAELHELSAWILDNLGNDVPLHFTAFHPDWKMQDNPRPPVETLSKARRIALQNGLRYVYTGNVHDQSGGSTYCHHCGEQLINRDWYQLGAWHLDGNGCCTNCGTPCAGVFEARPGDWGAKRMAVRFA